MQGAGDAYWGVRDSNIHFCEPAYERSAYVAEFWNAWTNLVAVAGSIFAFWFLFLRTFGTPESACGTRRAVASSPSSAGADGSSATTLALMSSGSGGASKGGDAASESSVAMGPSKSMPPVATRKISLGKVGNPFGTSMFATSPFAKSGSVASTRSGAFRGSSPLGSTLGKRLAVAPAPTRNTRVRSPRWIFKFHALSCLAFLMVGIGSFFFHATQRYWAELVDEIALMVLEVCISMSLLDMHWLTREPRTRVIFYASVFLWAVGGTALYI